MATEPFAARLCRADCVLVVPQTSHGVIAVRFHLCADGADSPGGYFSRRGAVRVDLAVRQDIFSLGVLDRRRRNRRVAGPAVDIGSNAGDWRIEAALALSGTPV